MVFGVTDLGQRGSGGRLSRLGQGVHDVRHLVDPAPLVGRFGEDVCERPPEAQCPVTDCEHRGPHAPTLQIAEHVEPGLGGLAVPVGDRDQFFCPVSTHADDDQDTQPGLFKTDPEMDPVGEHVDVVDVFERAVGEVVAFSLPLGRQAA